MFKKILVPLDGSIHAEQAIPVAAHIARACEGSIVLLQVVHTPIEHEAYMPECSPLTQKAFDAELTEDTTYLKIRAASGELVDIKTEIEVRVGLPAPTILAFAESISADLIVMSSHGYTGLKRWVLGSVADKLVRHASVPVLVLRDQGSVPSTPQQDTDRPLRALVALDGSALSEAALEPAAYLVAALALPTQGALHLVRVVDLLPNYGKFGSLAFSDTGLIKQAKQEAETYLSSISDRLFHGALADLHLAVTTDVVTNPDVAEALIKEAEDSSAVDGTEAVRGCDLIAMATHGRGGLERWAVGSVTERVLHATRLPLLVVRPKKAKPLPESKDTKTADEKVLVPSWGGFF